MVSSERATMTLFWIIAAVGASAALFLIALFLFETMVGIHIG